MKTKIYATGPNGLLVSRTTDRTYTHVVWCKKTEHLWRRKLESAKRHHEGELAKYQNDLDSHGPLTVQWGAAMLEKWIRGAKAGIENVIGLIEDGFEPVGWQCLHWCGRHDLAVKQAAQYTAPDWEVCIHEVIPNIETGSAWNGQGGYYSGRVIVERVKEVSGTVWIRFNLEGHGEEEISIEEFRKYFKPAAEPAFVVEDPKLPAATPEQELVLRDLDRILAQDPDGESVVYAVTLACAIERGAVSRSGHLLVERGDQ